MLDREETCHWRKVKQETHHWQTAGFSSLTCLRKRQGKQRRLDVLLFCPQQPHKMLGRSRPWSRVVRVVLELQWPMPQSSTLRVRPSSPSPCVQRSLGPSLGRMDAAAAGVEGAAKEGALLRFLGELRSAEFTRHLATQVEGQSLEGILASLGLGGGEAQRG